MTVTATDLSFFQHLYGSVAEEMGASLTRTAFSPNIKERRDFSCAVFDLQGRLLAQAAHIPVHLGAMPRSVEAALAAFPDLKKGDAVLLNDPFSGGTHLPDLTVVSPVENPDTGKPFLYLATRAHHADVGGISPGSLPVSSHILEEGIRIPPVLLMRNGSLESAVVEILCANTRTPVERRGDLRAQVNAHLAGEKRGESILKRYGSDHLSEVHEALLDYGEAMLTSTLKALPEGEFTGEEVMDSGTTLRCRLLVADGAVTVDLRDCDPAVDGSCNAVRAITESAVIYCFLCLMHSREHTGLIPVNGGCFRPLNILTSEGSVVDARWPTAVAGGNVETSQRIVEVVFNALALALPDRIPAQSQGTMNNITLGGMTSGGAPFSYYETIGGGAGASAAGTGMSGRQVHMTNTLNTPVEALEFAYPMRINRYAVRENSGGDGEFRGGDGVVREYQFDVDAQVTLLTERRVISARGLHGGCDGQKGANVLIRDGEEILLGDKCTLKVSSGDVIKVYSPGGGGWNSAPGF